MDIKLLYNHFLTSTSICTDTRKIKPGCLFFALKGESFNGNDFALEALEKGAGWAVVDGTFNGSISKQIIVVDDVLRMLQDLAGHHRTTLDIPIISVTGSNGKTTTKELIRIVLSKKYKVCATPGNFNNHIGVPLSLLQITPEIEMAVIEMGDNHLGEVAAICEYAKPNFGIITNIGKDHLEGFGSFENNIRAKSELYHYLIQHGGNAFINAQDRILSNMAKRFPQPIFYGKEGSDAYVEFVSANPYIVYHSSKGEVVQTKISGRFNFENIMTAIAVGHFFNVPEVDIHEAIKSYVPSNNRSQLLEKETNIIMLDAYNANPSSVQVAMESLHELETAKQKVVILGDMFELGDTSLQEHRNMVQLAQKMAFDVSIFYGDTYKKCENSSGSFFSSREQLINYLKENPLEESYILLKGSRAMKLETLVQFL